jgi:myo-inositol 2-dehydrogenase / D-chiro-inositol 1-dehydrogenase
VSDLRVGIIGVGIMGAGHARYITDSVDGAVVTALFDLDAPRMGDLAIELSAKSGAVINQHSSVEALINDTAVDAVIICSPDGLHPEHLELCVKAKKPTLCEKPLAPRLEDAKKIAEIVKTSNVPVALGFMRRFDPGYIQLKEEIKSGKYGEVIQIRAITRNVSSPGATTAGMISNSAVHEFDIARWLLEEEFTTVSTAYAKRTSHANPDIQDAISILAHTESGVLMTVDNCANSTYGYDVRVEVLMQNGSLELNNLGDLTVSFGFELPGRKSGRLHDNWIGRFTDAYIGELRAWVASIKDGVVNPNLATVDDGIAASIACEKGIASL